MYLVELELTNIRAIRKMSLSFKGTTPEERTRRWTVLLGENGCGKSTVLKSIALLLAGSEALPDLLGTADQWIHNSADQGLIRAVIATAEGKERVVSLELNRGDGRDTVIKNNAKRLAPLDAAIRKADRNYFIAGYGAFRRPPGPSRLSQGRRYRGRSSSVTTMFSTEEDLVSLESWAMDLDYKSGAQSRAVISGALNKLLPGMEFKDIDKDNGNIVMGTVDGDVPLRQLSEGYQAMAAWAGDLLYRMTQTFMDRTDPLAARGVLLIDEMDLHLHPRWKRTLVDFLNSAFPNLQIIATTHSPLSVQQCNEGELFVVRRDGSGPCLLPFAGDPSRMRLSELFLSPLIGLETLDSPKVAGLRKQAREIELKSGSKSESDLQTLRSIQVQLEGTTPLTGEEAPGFAKLISFQKGEEQRDPQARMLEAESLYGTARVSVSAARGDGAAASNVAKARRPAPKKKAASTSPAKTTARKTAKKTVKSAPAKNAAPKRSNSASPKTPQKKTR